MKVVFISDNGSHHKKITINVWSQFILPLLLVILVVTMTWNPFLASTKLFASSTDSQAFKGFETVLNKLSMLDAEVQRLNSLGTLIASKSKIDIDDFDLQHVPARGGALRAANIQFDSSIIREMDFENSIRNIQKELKKQYIQFNGFHISQEIEKAKKYLDQLFNRSTDSNIVYDFSTPLETGYISSTFGNRRDPINGSFRHHNGLDIAAKKGSNVYAIASGFVTLSGKKGAYGNLLEINHSESLKSRYAHLNKLLVKKGQIVRKGDLIAKVGATGRVTGAHLHLEILENDKVSDPVSYLNSALGRFIK